MKIDKREITKSIFMFIVIFIVLAINFYVLFINVRKNAIAGKEQEIYKVATEYNYFLIESLDAIKLSSQKLQEMVEHNRPTEELVTYLERETTAYSRSVNENFTGFYGVFNGVYLDGAGWVPDDDYNPYERPWYEAAFEADGEPAFVTPYLDMQTGTVMMSVSRLLSDKDSVVSMDVSLSGVQGALTDNALNLDWTYGMILDSKGTVVAHSDEEELGKNYQKDKGGIGYLIYKSMQNNGGNHFFVKYEGTDYIVFCADINNDWKAVSVIRSKQILGSMNSILFIFIITLIIIFSIIIFSMIRTRKKQQLAMNTNNQLNALANIYRSIFLINIEEDTFYEMSNSSTIVKQIIGDNSRNAQYTIRAVMDTVTDVRYKKTIYDFINFTTLDERLKGKKSITKDFVSNENQRCRGRFVPVEWNDEGSLKFVIWLVEIVE